MNKLVLIALCAAASVAHVQAVEVNVKNNTKKDLHIQGYGLGCAGVTLGRGLMCGTKAEVIKPGQTKKVTYRTQQFGTSGGIKALSLQDGAYYEKKAPDSTFKEFGKKTLQFPADFKRISPDLAAAKKKLIPKLDAVRRKLTLYVQVFNEDNNTMIANEKDDQGGFWLPVGGDMFLRANAKGEPEFKVTNFKRLADGKEGSEIALDLQGKNEQVSPGFDKAKKGAKLK